MALLPIGGEWVRLDDEDVVRVCEFDWHISQGYATTTLRADTVRTVPMHQVLIGRGIGKWDCVDHMNGNRLDNRKDNLRIVSRAINNTNRSIWKKGTRTGVMGVFPNHNRFSARITVHGRKIHLGTYDTIEDARAVRIAAELQHFGHLAPHVIRGQSA